VSEHRGGRSVEPRCTAFEEGPNGPIRDEVMYQTGPRRDPWHFRRSRTEKNGRLAPALTCGFCGADDGTRTRDPHLGNSMADVSCVFAGLSSVAELHVLGDLVSRVSVDRWSRLHFVGDFVGVRRVRFCCRARYVMSIASAGFLPPFLKLLEDIRVTEWLRPRRTLVPSDLPHCGHAVSGGRP
jgi:hypothetical protein